MKETDKGEWRGKGEKKVRKRGEGSREKSGKIKKGKVKNWEREGKGRCQRGQEKRERGKNGGKTRRKGERKRKRGKKREKGEEGQILLLPAAIRGGAGRSQRQLRGGGAAVGAGELGSWAGPGRTEQGRKKA